MISKYIDKNITIVKNGINEQLAGNLCKKNNIQGLRIFLKLSLQYGWLTIPQDEKYNQFKVIVKNYMEEAQKLAIVPSDATSLKL